MLKSVLFILFCFLIKENCSEFYKFDWDNVYLTIQYESETYVIGQLLYMIEREKHYFSYQNLTIFTLIEICKYFGYSDFYSFSIGYEGRDKKVQVKFQDFVGFLPKSV